MKKISKLSIVAFVFATLAFTNKTFADWNNEPAREIELNTVEYYGDSNYDASGEMTWPIPYTESHTIIENLANVDPVNVEKTSSSLSNEGWTGGPSYTPPGGNPPVTEGIIPPADSHMPLANKDLVVDDGVRVLSASMPPGYPLVEYVETKEIIMETDSNQIVQDVIRDWVAKECLTLREVLTQWADVEGWEIVWNTKREYPLKASAIFRGRFKDVSSAIIRSFSRATPQPLAKFYLGNRVLVVKTLEENDGN